MVKTLRNRSESKWHLVTQSVMQLDQKEKRSQGHRFCVSKQLVVPHRAPILTPNYVRI